MSTFAVSFPIPVFPPVTMTTFPARFGMSFAVQVGRGMKTLCLRISLKPMARKWAQERGIGIEETSVGMV